MIFVPPCAGLTVANLNRIKHLEALVDQHKAALEEAENENEELRGELQRSASEVLGNEEAEEEAKVLREVLAEREAQLISLTKYGCITTHRSHACLIMAT